MVLETAVMRSSTAARTSALMVVEAALMRLSMSAMIVLRTSALKVLISLRKSEALRLTSVLKVLKVYLSDSLSRLSDSLSRLASWLARRRRSNVS